MSDEMDVLFDRRLRNALHGTSLPAAPTSLRSALEDLPRTAGTPTARSVPRRTAGAALAAGLAAVAVLGGAAIFGLGGFGPAGEATPTPSPSASASPSPKASPSRSPETFNYLNPAEILEGRADGTVGSERVGVWGFYSGIRMPADPLDLRQGIAENDALIGDFSREDVWRPNPAAGAVLIAQWPPAAVRDDPEAIGLLALAPPDAASPLKPSLVLIEGHFVEPRALECPDIAAPPCIDRFDVDDVISFDDPYANASPGPSATATPFPFDSPPPPPSWMANCSQSRSATGPEPGDPIDFGYAREGWIPRAELPFEFLGSELLPEFVYYAEVDPEIPLGAWQEPVTGTADDFRWWGTSVCVASESGISYTWVPGSTYKLYRDGRRVDGGDPFDPPASASPAP